MFSPTFFVAMGHGRIYQINNEYRAGQRVLNSRNRREIWMRRTTREMRRITDVKTTPWLHWLHDHDVETMKTIKTVPCSDVKSTRLSVLLICSAVGVARHALGPLLASSRRKCSDQRLSGISSPPVLQRNGDTVGFHQPVSICSVDDVTEMLLPRVSSLTHIPSEHRLL